MADDDDQPQGVSAAEVPSIGRGDFAQLNKALRACHVCRLVKSESQFIDQGCDNCQFLDMAEDRDKVDVCTTPNFSGMISVIDPSTSWACKWVHLAKYRPGCYALVIDDDMPRRLRELLENRGIRVHHNAG